MNKYLKYTLKGFGIFIGIILILYTGIYLYVSVNKQSIIKQVTKAIGEKINGNVTIGNVEMSFWRHFPQASAVLQNVTITDTMFAQHHHEFFKGEEVYIQLSLMKLIKKEASLNGLRIERGSFYIFTDTSGYSNDYLFKQKNKTDSTKPAKESKNELKDILLKDVHFTIDDKKRQKLHDIMVNELTLGLEDRDASTLVFNVNSDMLIHSLAFNLSAGSFVKEKTFEGNFEMRFDKKQKQLIFDSIPVKIQDHAFRFSGYFDLVKPAPQFSLQIHTRDIHLDFVKTLLTKKISTALSIVDLDKGIDVDADIKGPLKGGDPLIKINWSSKDNHLKTPFVDFDNASFSGYYTDEVTPGLPRRDPNSEIEIKNFSAEWKGLPVTSESIMVLNLFRPEMTCDLKSNFSLTTLNDVLGESSFQLKAGTGTVDLSYKGPLAKNNNTNSFVNGVVAFKNGLLVYTPRDVEMKNVNGRLLFKNSNVFVQNLQCIVMNNKVQMEGSAKNLLTLINTEPNKVNIDWSVYTPSFNLNDFTYLLKARKKVVVSQQKNKLQSMARQIDAVLEKGSINVSLRADKLLYNKFDATNVTGLVSLLQDSYILHKVSMEHAGGRMDISGALYTQKINYHQAKVNATLNNVDVKKVLIAFNNFGQDGITSQSLQGKLTAEANVSMGLDDNGKVYPATVEGIVDFSLKDGALINYEPVKKMQVFVFKKRDFDNIQFAELKDRLEIKNQEVKINRMEIQSSVMSMFVEGIFSMKGKTDMSIQVPLSNLKKRGADYIPENAGTDKKGGSSIFLRGTPGSDGNIKFKLDLFNKFKKGKEKREAANQ